MTREEIRIRWAEPLRYDPWEAVEATDIVRRFAVVGLDRKPGKRNAILYRLRSGRMCAAWWTPKRAIVIEFYKEPTP